MTNVKKFLSLFCLSAIFSTILFEVKSIRFESYLMIAFGCFFFFVINYRFTERKLWKNFYIPIALSNLLVYLYLNFLQGFWPVGDLTDCFFASYLAILFLIVLHVLVTRKIIKSNLPKDLFPSRKFDLKVVNDYIQRFPIVGVNALWGDGKTHLFDFLKSQQDYSNKYCFITIEAMSSAFDSVEKYVVAEINHELESNRIFSTSSSKIRTFLKQPALHGLGDVVFSHDSYCEIIQSLKDDVKRLNKIIVLVFEDIDRISKRESIEKIFSLAEMLTSKIGNIKIVYQYDEHKLMSLMNVKHDYIEKYIPYTVNLTPIRNIEMIRFMLEEMKNEIKSSLNEDDFGMFTTPAIANHYIKEKFGFSFDMHFKAPGTSIRKIKIFIQELDISLQKDDFRTYRKEIVVFFIIKHFLHELYENLNVYEPFSEMKLFEVNGEKYSFKEFLKLENVDYKVFLKNQMNSNCLALFHFLEYEFRVFIDEGVGGADQEFFDMNYVKECEHNRKIDRIIRNVLWSGKSEWTDLENGRHLFNELVLNRPEEDREKNYIDFQNIMYYGNSKKRDNTTIFWIGRSPFIPLFQAFDIWEKDDNCWIGLIDFYLKKENITEIRESLLEHLILCTDVNRKVYLHIVQRFNRLKVVENLSSSAMYKSFLDIYLNAMSRCGFINTHETNFIDDHSFSIAKERDVMIDFVLSPLKDRLGKLRENSLENVEKDVFELVCFIEKNIEILNCSQQMVIKQKKSPFGITFSDVKPYEKLKKEIKDKKMNEDEVRRFLSELYDSGKINADCVKNILEWFLKEKPND